MELRSGLSLTLTIVTGTINWGWLLTSDEAPRTARPASLLITFHH